MRRSFYIWQGNFFPNNLLCIIIAGRSIWFWLVFITELATRERISAFRSYCIIIFWSACSYNLFKCPLTICSLSSWTQFHAISYFISSIRNGHLLLITFNSITHLSFTSFYGIKCTLGILHWLKSIIIACRSLCPILLLLNEIVTGSLSYVWDKFSCVIKLLALSEITAWGRG